MICDSGDVVVVPFPFTDLPVARKRPVLVLSSRAFNEGLHHSVFAMITTASRSAWSGDVRITDLAAAGLLRDCIVRWKIVTLPNDLIHKRLGALSSIDRGHARRAFEDSVLGPVD